MTNKDDKGTCAVVLVIILIAAVCWVTGLYVNKWVHTPMTDTRVDDLERRVKALEAK